MEEQKKKQYSGSKSIVKGLAPILIPIISEAISATTGMDKTAAYSSVTAVYGLIVGLKNWFKNRKK
ncbi:MAG: hypothetical protein PHE88_12400 [Elusimicrobia bacterium]|nr:hypothetical protein [Elusimicrobiota bacterium]